MGVKLNHVIIHELIKEQHNDIQPSKLRNTVLPAENKVITTLIDGIVKLYGRKNNSAQYGVFRNDEGQGDFPENIRAYKKHDNPTAQEFIALSAVGMTELFKRAENEKLASGGYILFADYTDINHNRFFLIAMVKQKPGYHISGNLTIEDLEYIDLSRLHQAARINFSKLDKYEQADDAERADISYLSFVSPSSNKSTAGYFSLAFGCQAGTSSSTATLRVLSESIKFFKTTPELNQYVTDIKQDITNYLHQKSEAKDTVKLSEIEKLARRYFPADDEDKAEKLADNLLTHLNSEEVGIPAEFGVSKSKLRQITHLSYKDKSMTLLFDKEELGETPDARIYFNDNKLIINNLPDALKAQLESHFKGA
ncbi:Nucleoid-associated protein YejK [Photobacterium damselae subsp. damselae]|uniref:nucleoid-associated protein n=1 Tax=Photobacterium damselae TaxID=38293 RepID=UPI00109BC206|nr:nucleoid-associated protein [Photobacterium damselae]TGZ34911.1 Nucleoid-associated protein YejK [Photobacterium damselae subsp. damselae]